MQDDLGGDASESGLLVDEILVKIEREPFIGVGGDTLPETKIAPENGWLEDYFPFGMAYFQGLC